MIRVVALLLVVAALTAAFVYAPRQAGCECPPECRCGCNSGDRCTCPVAAHAEGE